MDTKAATTNQRDPATKPMRLGFGGCAPARNVFARWCFFQATVRRVPAAIAALVAISQRSDLKSFDAGCLDDGTEDALSVWAKNYGVPYEDWWWSQPLRFAVRHWHSFPEEAGKWPGVVGSYKAQVWPTLQWRATEETEQAFRGRVEEYISRLKALPGVNETPETFTERHFEAFVLEHVAQERIERIPEILELADVDVSSIRKRNSQLAALLGLKLRRQRPGRPPRIIRNR